MDYPFFGEGLLVFVLVTQNVIIKHVRFCAEEVEVKHVVVELRINTL